MSSVKMEVPSYYRRLNEYFPSQELKHPDHLTDLVRNEPFYHKWETGDALLLFAEFQKFLFVDYLLVDSRVRGRGIGATLLHKLQSRNKPIVLEIEPPDEHQPDTVRRRNFYHKCGFKPAEGVLYERIDAGSPFVMDIWYWSEKSPLPDRTVLGMMSTVCTKVHNHQSDRYYEQPPAEPDKVLSLAQT